MPLHPLTFASFTFLQWTHPHPISTNPPSPFAPFTYKIENTTSNKHSSTSSQSSQMPTWFGSPLCSLTCSIPPLTTSLSSSSSLTTSSLHRQQASSDPNPPQYKQIMEWLDQQLVSSVEHEKLKGKLGGANCDCMPQLQFNIEIKKVAHRNRKSKKDMVGHHENHYNYGKDPLERMLKNYFIPTIELQAEASPNQHDAECGPIRRLPIEEPIAHLKKFLCFSNTIRVNNVPTYTICLRLFPFSLADRVFEWLTAFQMEPSPLGTSALVSSKESRDEGTTWIDEGSGVWKDGVK
ncbi:hypothetical protein CR513_32070, partial [Mucuna pruriens]